MWETFETCDDVAMQPGIFGSREEKFLCADRCPTREGLEQCDGSILQVRVLGMLQWQIHKERLDRVKLGVDPLAEGAQCDFQPQPVKVKRAAQAAVQVAWELVQYQDQGQR